jgi:hypothetical protein
LYFIKGTTKRLAVNFIRREIFTEKGKDPRGNKNSVSFEPNILFNSGVHYVPSGMSPRQYMSIPSTTCGISNKVITSVCALVVSTSMVLNYILIHY